MVKVKVKVTLMTTATAMPTEPSGALSPHSFLQLMWLASPALPIGGFSYSEGLEAAIDMADVDNEDSVADWISDQLHLSQSRCDMAVIAQALAAWRNHDAAQVQQLNDWVLMTRESSELRLQTEQMGKSLTDWLRNQHTQNAANTVRITQLAELSERKPTYPIAFALAADLVQAPVQEALLAYAFGWAENMVQAAIKTVPLGQSSGQRILARLAHEIPAAAAHAQSLPDNARQAFSPMLAILSARHEHQYSRLFRS